MTGIEFAIFYVGWKIAGGSPGPATLSIAGTSMEQGRKSGLIFALGILVGSASLGLAAASGMSALMLANAWVFEVLRYVGAAYLLFLASKALRSAMRPDAVMLTKNHSGSARRIFSRGMMIHLTNPKAILSWGAVYSIALPKDAGAADVFGLFGILYCGSIVIFLGYALLFSSPAIVQGYKRMRRGFDLLFAAFFGAASLKLLTAKLA